MKERGCRTGVGSEVSPFNPVAPSLGGIERNAEELRPSARPDGGMGEAKLARDARTLPNDRSAGELVNLLETELICSNVFSA